ncbi:MAG: VOC family protein [Tepidisphaeraceae bacterium]
MAKAKPIPDGYHAITPYIRVRGAADAIEFYKKAFGAEELCRMPGPGGTIMHAEIRIGDSIIMLGEESKEWNCPSPLSIGGTGAGLHLYVTDADAAFARATGAGAKVKMPLANMFWGDRYGAVTDPFGHEWSIGTHLEDLTTDEIARRGQIEMAKMAKG